MSELKHLSRLLAESGDPRNPGARELQEILERVRTIAVVGISRDPTKAARRVPSYLAAKGYGIIPVNPHAERILGRPAHPSLGHVEEAVDLVLVFRPPSEAGSVLAEAAGRLERPAIWLQEGIQAPIEAARARERGLTVVQDLCIFKIHRALERPAALTS